jgi:hypothetical protein
MIFKLCPHHRQLWEFHLEGVSTGIYLQKTDFYVCKIMQAFQLLTSSIQNKSLKCEICTCFVHCTHFC